MKDGLRTDVLFVGHIPPPWTGQGVIHSMLLQWEYSNVRLVRLPMRFSRSSADQGKISLSKVLALCRLIVQTYRARFVQRICYLYFSPGGPSLSAVVRDALYLLTVRPIMRGALLVYHSSGVAEFICTMPMIVRPLVRYAFSGVEVAVQLSENVPPDGIALNAQEVLIIPNAVPDYAEGWFSRKPHDLIRLLYIGVVTIGKGILDLLKACSLLVDRGTPFELLIVGSFATPEEENILRQTAAALPLNSVIFVGALAGTAKHDVLRWADVFCMPSFWYTETFPLVLLEALSFGLPIIASRWRGIPDLVGVSGDSGFLVDIHSIDQIAAAIETLAVSPELRETQSRHARQRYDAYFTETPFHSHYDAAFTQLIAS